MNFSSFEFMASLKNDNKFEKPSWILYNLRNLSPYNIIFENIFN